MTTSMLQRTADRWARHTVAPSTPALLDPALPTRAPDHVPEYIAQEHPDASAVVVGAGHRSQRDPLGASRKRTRPSPSLRAAIGLVLCAGLAWAATDSDDAAQPQRPDPTDVRTAESAGRVPANVPQCTDPTADPRQRPFLQLVLGPCPVADSSEPVLWDLVEIARDRGIVR